MDIRFKPKAIEEYNKFALKDKKTFKKLMKMILEIRRNPYQGIGKPEQLKHELTGCWSRRINSKDRLIYEIKENEIIIISCCGHYL